MFSESAAVHLISTWTLRHPAVFRRVNNPSGSYKTRYPSETTRYVPLSTGDTSAHDKGSKGKFNFMLWLKPYMARPDHSIFFISTPRRMNTSPWPINSCQRCNIPKINRVFGENHQINIGVGSCLIARMRADESKAANVFSRFCPIGNNSYNGNLKVCFVQRQWDLMRARPPVRITMPTALATMKPNTKNDTLPAPNDNFANLYRRAFAQYGAQALWNKRMLEEPTQEDALVIARSLRIEGDREARKLAEQIEKACRAAL